jgi:hypothetical protein
MRIVFDDVVKNDQQKQWEIKYHEEGDGARVLGDGSWQTIIRVAAFSMMDWRAAEYNIPPSDINTLIDIIVLEQYVTSDFFNGPNSLFNAPTVGEARQAYLAEIVRLKLLYRVSTRTKDNPLQIVRNNLEPSDPLDMAVKGMSVLMNRQVTGAEMLDPAVATVLTNFQSSMTFGPKG